MAESRRAEEEQDDGERRSLRDARARSQATDHLERTKPDHLHSSQGPLSSIRAAIKRTRTNSQSDITRDRRRPEITIVSAEPLDSSNWFSGASVVFPPSPQSGWSAGIQVVSQPPPSYDQVIKEKTQEEHVVRPTAAPRRSTCTATSATQTDPVREDATAAAVVAAVPHSGKRPSAGKKPQKPPRPSVPKPLDKEPASGTGGSGERKVATSSTNAETQSDLKTGQVSREGSAHKCTRSVTVHWDFPAEQPGDLLPAPAQTPPAAPQPGRSQTPVPLPRTKSRKQAKAEEARIQTLVTLSENCDDIKVSTGTSPKDASSNEYLKELLEAFSAETKRGENGDTDNQSNQASRGDDADGEMSVGHGQRNIQARIQAFESQGSAEDGDGAKPEPLPRKANKAPPVADKPSVALKPKLNHGAENDNQKESTTDIPQSPTPAARPQPPEKPTALPVRGHFETVPLRSRPVLTRANCIHEEEASAAPPTPPTKPKKEPLKPNLNANNHNSTFAFGDNVDSLSNHSPVKPQGSVDSDGGSFPRKSVTRRPTTIRVPSKTGSLSDSFQDSPPPLPAQKPVGSLNTSLNHKQIPTPILPPQESFDFGPEPSLPPRRSNSSRAPPPRPPPAKIGPARPPAPGLQAAGRSHSAPWETSPKPQTQRPQRRGPVLPPRPNPGHRLYNKYTLQLPHAVAAFDYNGSNTGELSFQKNEVLLLLEEIDRSTYECQVGDTRGRVHTSRMKVITPLGSGSEASQFAGPAGSGGPADGLKVQATHDFIPEGPDELGLRAGDVVTRVEQVDSEWYTGTCRGSTGFFPINYVTVLSGSPRSLPERKTKTPLARVSGPRCVARFDFEGEHGDELSFCEGDVIQLQAYVGTDWARGQLAGNTGIFPLNFVEVVEDLPPPPPSPASQQQTHATRIPLPGMVASPSPQPEAAKPAQSPVEWATALYDFAGKSEDELSFRRGDCILVTQHLDAEWSSGRLNGREGMFPRAFVEISTGQQPSHTQENGGAGGGRGRALYNYASTCDEELSLQAGDIVTNLESIDDEWFLGDLNGKRALVPKNYVLLLT